MSAGHLHQHTLVGELRRRDRSALFKLQHVFWGLWKGLSEDGMKRGELTLVAIGGMMSQGKHSLGHLCMEWNSARPKTLLILLLCHPHGSPLYSNTPPVGSPRRGTHPWWFARSEDSA